MKIAGHTLLAWLAAAGALLAQSGAPSPPATGPRQLLETSRRRGQLEMDDTVPYYLKASYQLFSGDGKPAEAGTLEELWKDPSHYRLTVTHPDGVLVETRNGEQHWQTGSGQMQNRIMLAVNGALKPFWDMPTGDRLFIEAPPNGDPTLDCIGTEPDIPGVSADVRIAETTFCMSKGSHLLRLILRPSGFSIRLNDTQRLGDKKYIPRSIEIPGSGGSGPPWITLHIDSLVAADDLSMLDEPRPADARTIEGDGEPPHFFYKDGSPAQEGLLGQVLDSPTPPAPSSFGPGTVVLHLGIDTSGNVTAADVISSPNSALGAYAVGVVKKWHYRVSHRGDELVPNVQIVTLHF